jgi:hypothetical protein
MTIGDIQQQAKDLSARQGWANTTIAERVTFLIGEIQEMAEEALLLAAQDSPRGSGGHAHATGPGELRRGLEPL